jgi:hypothetical protein
MVGFDLARTFTPMEALGRAHGIVNGGGFSVELLRRGEQFAHPGIGDREGV